MIGVSGKVFFKTDAASTPFNRGILDSVYAVHSLAHHEFTSTPIK